MDYSPPDSSVHGILQARIVEWVAMPTSGNLPDPGIKPGSLKSPALAGGFFTTSTTWEAQEGIGAAAAAATKSRQLRPTLCDPTDGSPPGSLVPGIL